ncbi:exonuclease V a 5' deoxyribonuclease-domain-containing protein [Tuber brumale]|nr:exonuclease V a 5' deoxyribonuclease-domain-containing protein [Tuber brumale]
MMTPRKLLTMPIPSVQGGLFLLQCSRTTLSIRIARKDSFDTPNSLSGRTTNSPFSTLASAHAQMRVAATDGEQSKITSAPPILGRNVKTQPEIPPAGAPIPLESEIRSPLDRFRYRTKTLSVTDLVSGVWCEQQFEYSLERGSKRSTSAMKKGTKVHKVLEEQVHTTVQVEVATKEDRWGLKLFNVCQGLLTLRHGGLTRELNVFGFLNGYFIQGIIDEISYTHPGTYVAAKAPPTVASDESSDEDEDGGVLLPIDLTNTSPPPSTPEHGLIAYVSDTKTRASQTVPGGSQLRAAVLQLMLYRHLLSGLHAGNVDFTKLLENFGLDGSKNLSDKFLAQIASLDSEVSLEELLKNNSLWGFWGILQRKLRENINTISNTLAIRYRSQKHGGIMEIKTFDYDEALLTEHLNHTIDWWQGKRPAVGVEIEEAWKCAKCEFESDCTWRLAKIEELKRAREAKNTKRKRSVSPNKQKKT